jgi:hypothetical protein
LTEHGLAQPGHLREPARRDHGPECEPGSWPRARPQIGQPDLTPDSTAAPVLQAVGTALTSGAGAASSRRSPAAKRSGHPAPANRTALPGHTPRRLFPGQPELADQWRDHDNRDRTVPGHRLRDRHAIIGAGVMHPGLQYSPDHSHPLEPAYPRRRHVATGSARRANQQGIPAPRCRSAQP